MLAAEVQDSVVCRIWKDRCFVRERLFTKYAEKYEIPVVPFKKKDNKEKIARPSIKATAREDVGHLASPVHVRVRLFFLPFPRPRTPHRCFFLSDSDEYDTFLAHQEDLEET